MQKIIYRATSSAIAVSILLFAGCGWVQQSDSATATTPTGASTDSPSSTGTAPGALASGPIAGAQTMTLYTCATDTTVQAVIDGFTALHPGTSIELFRAPTGELNARVAADLRGAGIGADAIWACDPLTMQGYLGQGIVRSWVPEDASAVPTQYRTADYVGVDLLYVVAAVHAGVAAPVTWSDLTDPAYKGHLAIPNPEVAASALGLLGYLNSAPDYGIAYYRALSANGAVQVDSPTDVVTGVAQGTYDAGIVLANAAYQAKAAGSPIDVVWPKPGAVAVYAPIAITTRTAAQPLAEAFIAYVASEAGQKAMAATNVYPVLADVAGPTIPSDASVISPDWSALSSDTNDLLASYRAIFG